MQTQPLDITEAAPVVQDPYPVGLLGLAVVAAVLLDVGLRGGPANVLVAFGLMALAGIVATGGRVQQVAARRMAWCAMVPLVFLGLRASPWLAATNLASSALLTVLAIAFARSGRVRDVTPFGVVSRAFAAAAGAVHAPALMRGMVERSDTRARRRVVRALRVACFAVPFLVAVTALLASADAVFENLAFGHFAPATIAGHVVLIAVVAGVAVVVAAVAPGADVDIAPRPGRLDAFEVVIALGLALAVLAAFAAAQVIALSDAGRRLIVQSGLTPAEYARSGFFQLCWAIALLLTYLAIVRGLAAPGTFDRPHVRVLAGLVPLMTLGLVVVSLRRMALYDAAFGLTMLRVWVIGAALWMGAVLCMVAVRNFGIVRSQHWLVLGAVVTALALTLVADVIDPEAFVTRHDIERAQRGKTFDAVYVAGLSDDAIPAVVDAIDRSPDGAVRTALRDALRCDEAASGVATFNVAVRRAADVRARVCTTTMPVTKGGSGAPPTMLTDEP